MLSLSGSRVSGRFELADPGDEQIHEAVEAQPNEVLVTRPATSDFLAPVFVPLALSLLVLVQRIAQNALAPHDTLGVFYIVIEKMLTKDIIPNFMNGDEYRAYLLGAWPLPKRPPKRRSTACGLM